MADIDRDRISIVSKRSVTSAASRRSTLWSKIPLSSRRLSSPLADICSYIGTTPDAPSSPVNELIIYKEEKGVHHEFLLLRMAKPTGEEFWVRLERTRPVGALGNLISSALEANDIASLSGKRAALLGSTKSVEKTRIIFRDPPSLTDLLRVLEALRESSKFYKVWPENCYFFASVVAEYLYGLDNKSGKLTGTLRWLDLGADARRRIHQIIASYDRPPVQDGSESGRKLPLGSPAFESAIDWLETEDMSTASSTSLPKSLRRSKSQMLLSQDAYSTVELNVQDHPLKRVPSLADSLSGSDDESDYSSPPSVRRPTEEDILRNIPHMGDTEYTLGVFCTKTHDSEEAEAATVTRMIRYRTTRRVPHRFLLLEVMKRGTKFWIRLDRRPRSENLFKILALYIAANDLVKITTVLHNLLGRKVRREAVIEFASPIPLKSLVKTLDVVHHESIMFNLSGENCWFFTSIIQEISVQFLGGSFSDDGGLNSPSLAVARRRAIKEKIYKVLPTPVPTLVTEVESMAAMTHNKLLVEAISQLAQIVAAQDKLLLCSSLDEARLRFGRQSSLIRLLSESKMTLYEHLHGLSDVPGARRLRNGFSRDFAYRLKSWLSSVGGTLKISERILDQDQMDKLVAEVTNLFSGAFEKETVRVEEDMSATLLRLQWKGYTSSSSTDLDLALWTLQHLSHCKSLLGLFGKHSHRLKEDVPDLQALFDSAIPPKATFACKSWISLVCRVRPADPGVAGALEQVVCQWLLYWVVAMGAMDEIMAACHGLHQLEQWMRGHDEMGGLRLHILKMYRFVLRSKQALVQSPFLVFSTPPFTDPNSSSIPSTSLYSAIMITALGNTQESWSRLLLKLQGHPHPVCSLAYSSDGTYVASAFRSKCIWVWNANTGIKVSKVDLLSDCVHVTFSPDGSQVGCACENGAIYICNADGSGKPVRLSGHSKRVNSIAFTSYGTRLASASGDTTVRIWDAAEGSNIHILEGHTDAVVSVVYSLDGTRLASASYDGTVRVWDAASGEQVRRIDVFSQMFCLVFHPDNERVILACKDGMVRILNIFEIDDNLLVLGNHSDAVYSVSCSADGKWIASASADSTISLWRADGTRWTHARTLVSHTNSVYAVAFSPNSARLASGSHDRSILIWDAETTVEQESKGVPCEIASNARFMVSVDKDKIIQLTDSNDPSSSPILLRGHSNSVTCACFSPDDAKLASASRDLSIRIWDINSGQCTKRVGLAEVTKDAQSSQWSFQAPYHMSYSKDGLVLRLRGWKVSDDAEGPFTVDLNTGTWLELPMLCVDEAFAVTYQPDLTLPIKLDRNCLCTPLENGLAYLRWLPDDFEPISEVIQTGRRVSVGGKGGEVAYVNFDEVSASKIMDKICA